MRIGLVPGSFKPYHVGHDMLVRIASENNDLVYVFSSTADRKRKGELPLYGADMHQVIDLYVKPKLPSNVEVIHVGVPVASVWDELQRAEAENSEDTFTIYSDSEDIQKFNEKSLMKYAPMLYSRGQINTRGIERGTETPDVSGTKMREYIRTNDVESFTKMLPPSIQQHGQEIFNILKKPLSESILKAYIRQTIKDML